MQSTLAILRSFLRFLATRGEAPAGLDRHLESPRQYRGERLVRALPWDAVQRLLQTIDHSTLKGRRDYAIFLLIATYGLRASEVAALDLKAVVWRARVIHVPRPKIGTPLAVPLTDDLATALLECLRGQTRDPAQRRLFLRVRGPRGPITAATVGDAFDVWASQAGVRVPTLGGPHCIRHALAMHLLSARHATQDDRRSPRASRRRKHRRLSAPPSGRPPRRGAAAPNALTRPVAEVRK
jgi:integrase/recombinase XerD